MVRWPAAALIVATLEKLTLLLMVCALAESFSIPAAPMAKASPASTMEPEVLVNETPSTLVTVASLVAVPAAPLKTKPTPLVGAALFVQFAPVDQLPDPPAHSNDEAGTNEVV